ncbi:MAG: efflux RND transporter periplasmic adaptor subunit [Pseudomonadota bacterium]
MNAPKEARSVIDQLRIERAPMAPPRDSRKLWLAGAVLAVAALATGGVRYLQSRPLAVQAAVAAPVEGGAGAGAALQATGYVVAGRQATVAAKITGRLTEVLFEEGQHVKAGQVLAKLDNSNAVAILNQARAQVELSKMAVQGKTSIREVSQRQLQRQRQLAASGWVSGNAVDTVAAADEANRNEIQIAKGQLGVYEAALVTAQRNLDDTVVRAPFDGVVTVKAAQPGEIISPSSAGGFTRTGICTIVAMDSLEVTVDVNENFINRIRPGQAATVTLNAYKDWQIAAAVIAVVPTADRAKATVGVRLAFKEKDARILPQMGVNVSFHHDGAPLAGAAPPPRGVTVPAAAVVKDGDGAVVYVIRGDSVERRTVKLGPVAGASQQILAGLASGERVALGELAKLNDGALVHLN